MARILVLLLLARPALLLQPNAQPLRLSRRACTPAHAFSRSLIAVMEAEAEAEEAAADTAAEPEVYTEAEAEPTPSEASATEESPVKSEKDELKEKIAALEAQLKLARGTLIDAQEQVKDAGEAGYMLLAADFERYRVQAREELSLQEGVGRRAAVKPLLQFVEEFERLQTSNEETDEANAIHKYYAGIYKQLTQLLESWEVSSFEATVGERCDPALHSKDKIVESDEQAGTILEVVAKGWMMGSEALRPAACVVSSGPPLPPSVAEDAEAAAEEMAEETEAVAEDA